MEIINKYTLRELASLKLHDNIHLIGRSYNV